MNGGGMNGGGMTGGASGFGGGMNEGGYHNAKAPGGAGYGIYLCIYLSISLILKSLSLINILFNTRL
jgi:hypothetical protein